MLLKFILICPVGLSSGHVHFVMVSSHLEVGEDPCQCLFFHCCAHCAALSKNKKHLLHGNMIRARRLKSLFKSCTLEF